MRQASIYVVAADGRRPRRPRRLTLPDWIGVGGGLAWSPDGKWIAFEDPNCLGIFVTRVDGSRRRPIAVGGNWCRDYGSVTGSDPDWQPLR